MTRACSVTLCKNPMKFRFPSDVNLRKKWLDAIRQPRFQPKQKQGICANHFKKNDFHIENAIYGKF